jgi:hypothetical protein
MGVKILNEDGSVLHEFPEGLGAPLLYRVLAVARFTGEDQPEIILNHHVAALHRAVGEAMPPGMSAPSWQDADELARTVRQRIDLCFREQVISGQLPWPRWSMEEKRAFVRDVLFSPVQVSDQYLADFVEEADGHFARVRAALGDQEPAGGSIS